MDPGAVLGGQEEGRERVVGVVEELAQPPRVGERRDIDVDADEAEQLVVFEGGGSRAIDAGEQHRGWRRCRDRSGIDGDAPISGPNARWVLATIRDGLRPRVLVQLGMRTLLTVGREVCGLFADAFKGVNMRCPHREYPLEAYTKRRLAFREWDTSARDGAPLLLVDWPQHPNRAPFTNTRWWSAACERFAAHHPSLIE